LVIYRLLAALSPDAAPQADAKRRHTEIMATVTQQKNALETRIAELRTFEREYRTRLRTMLQTQLEELDARGSAQPGPQSNNK